MWQDERGHSHHPSQGPGHGAATTFLAQKNPRSPILAPLDPRTSVPHSSGNLIPGCEGLGDPAAPCLWNRSRKPRNLQAAPLRAGKKNSRAQIHLFSFFLKPFPAFLRRQLFPAGVVAALGGSRAPGSPTPNPGQRGPGSLLWGRGTGTGQHPGETWKTSSASLEKTLQVSQGHPNNPRRNPTPPVPACR